MVRRSTVVDSAQQAAGKAVLTIEGLAAADGTLHPLQQAWVDENVPQCGFYRLAVMQALALLDTTLNRVMPTRSGYERACVAAAPTTALEKPLNPPRRKSNCGAV